LSNRQDQEIPLGERLRKLRKARGLTLAQLAERVGKSEGYLSRLERGQVNPSLSTLKRIADVLGRPVVQLLDDVVLPLARAAQDGGHRRLIVSPELEYVILSAPNDRFALFKVILAKGGSSGAEPYCHQGLEAGIVLKGKVRITVGGKSFVLEAGDSITYRSDFPHRFENVGDEQAIGIWVVSPPTF